MDTPTDPGVRYSDSTTKRGKELRDLARLLDADTFGEATTQGKKARAMQLQSHLQTNQPTGEFVSDVEAPEAPSPGSDDVTPRAQPLPAVSPKVPGKPAGPSMLSHTLPKPSSFVAPPAVRPMAADEVITRPMAPVVAMAKTPPPVNPLPPVGAKPVSKPIERTPPPTRPLPPVVKHAPARPPAQVSPPVPAMAAAAETPELDVVDVEPIGFADSLLDVMATAGRPAVGVASDELIITHSEPHPVPPLPAISISPPAPSSPVWGPMSASSSAGISLSPMQRHRGLVYVGAAVGFVVLVILLVVVSLRGDGAKAPQPVQPVASTTPAPEPAKAEPPKVEPAAAKPTDERPKPASPRKTKGSGKTGHGGSVAEELVPPPLPRGDSRPNPFAHPPVSQERISAVVRNPNNQAMLKSCYERALKRDNHLTSGRVEVTVSVGMSGSVQRVVINAPASFILVEPCIKSAVRRWAFPPNSEDYATNFPLIMQGGM
jgi:hypothetical protein